MFEATLALCPRNRRGTWLLSALAHAVLAGAVLVGPLFAADGPPEPDQKIGTLVPDRLVVRILDASAGEKPPATSGFAERRGVRFGRGSLRE